MTAEMTKRNALRYGVNVGVAKVLAVFILDRLYSFLSDERRDWALLHLDD